MSFVKHEQRFDVEGYLRSRDPKAKRYGNDVATNCPGCNKQKLWALTNPKQLSSGDVPAGSWICYYCGTHGRGAVSLVQQIENCDRASALLIVKDGSARETQRIDMKRLIADAFGDERRSKVDRFTEIELPAEFRSAWRGPKPLWFDERGLTPEQVKLHGIGYCLKGQYKNRCVVPVHDPVRGRIVSFVARYMAKSPPEGVKKVLYPAKTTEAPVLSRCLFNYKRAKKRRLIVIVEDVFSAIRVGLGAVATYGTNMSQAQIDLLLASRAEEIALMWDRDAMVRHRKRKCFGRCAHCARYEKTQRLLAQLAEYWPVRAVVMPDGRDPKDRTRGECLRLIQAAHVNEADDAFITCMRAKLS